jgi:hypothetical protein
MSFYTSVTYYRPTDPPPVTAAELADFIGQIRGTNLLKTTGTPCLKIKFGEAIDQDSRDTTWEEPIGRNMSVMREIAWDVHLPKPASLDEMISLIEDDQRRIYRAFVSLPDPVNALLEPITRENSPENEVNFYPASLSLEFGPVRVGTLATESRPEVGWVGVDLSGSGYLYPWTVREIVDRAQHSSAIQCIMQVCRSFWPVPSQRPPKSIVRQRTEMRELWPYDDYEMPWDWYWGVSET